MNIKLADNHCHISKEYFENPFEEIKRIKETSGLEYIALMGINYDNNIEYLEYKKNLNSPFLRIGAGFHPSEVISLGENARYEFLRIEEFVKNSASIIDFIGEVGIDFTYPDAKKYYDLQLEVFEKMCVLAKQYKLPLSIHARDSLNEIIGILHFLYRKSNINEFNGYLHCFTGTFENAVELIELGFKLGINGIITFKKSEELRNTIKAVLNFYSDRDFNDLFSLETDTPYLTPEPVRKEKNSPVNIKIIAEFVETNILKINNLRN